MSWFVVDTKGFREIQQGREPWSLVKELVSNVFDEPAIICEVKVERPKGKGFIILSVRDDSPGGFADIRDAYKLYGHTVKRSKPGVRGRFNLGEKEIIACSRSAKVKSTRGTISFNSDGTRTESKARTKEGSVVELELKWNVKIVAEIIEKLKRFLPPKGVRFTVNGEEIPYREPDKVTKAKLRTVILKEDRMMNTVRLTKVNLHGVSDRDGYLYELGIPVQGLQGCDWDVDIQQKVPLSPNRESVPPGYLRDVYAEVLNAVIDDLGEEDVSATWVREATEDERVEKEVLDDVREKRWGKKVVFKSTDFRANEQAAENGYTVVEAAKTLSREERERFKEVGDIQYASEVFKAGDADIKGIPIDKWTDGMKQIAALTNELGDKLIGKNVAVTIVRSNSSYAAWWLWGTITFNLSKLGKRWFEEGIIWRQVSIILHELAHNKGEQHDREYRQYLEELAGKAVMLAVEEPGTFR